MLTMAQNNVQNVIINVNHVQILPMNIIVTIVDQCKKGYFISSDSSKCLKCSTQFSQYCSECDQNQCYECYQTNHYLIPVCESQQDQNDVCGGDNVCQQCDTYSNCETCLNDLVTCNSCDEKVYTLIDGQCLKIVCDPKDENLIEKHCLTCDSQQKICKTCEKNRYLNDNKECICKENTDENGECQGVMQDLEEAVGQITEQGTTGVAGAFAASSSLLIFNPSVLLQMLDTLQQIRYTIYMQIEFPDIVYKYFEIFDMFNFEFLPNIVPINKYYLKAPYGFELNDTDGFFFRNVSQYFLISWGLLALYLFLRWFKYYIKKQKIFCLMNKRKLWGLSITLQNKVIDKFQYQVLLAGMIGSYLSTTIYANLQILTLEAQDLSQYGAKAISYLQERKEKQLQRLENRRLLQLQKEKIKINQELQNDQTINVEQKNNDQQDEMIIKQEKDIEIQNLQQYSVAQSPTKFEQTRLNSLQINKCDETFETIKKQQQTETKLKTITPRNFFRGTTDSKNLLQAGEEQQFLPPVLTYGIKYNSVLDQLAHDANDEATSNNIQIVAQCFVQTQFLEAENLLEISVQYTSIEKNLISAQTESSQENLLQQSEFFEMKDEIQLEEEEVLQDFFGEPKQEEFSQRQTPFFVLYVDFDSGKIQKLLRENAYDEDKTLNWITQQFVNDLFPEARQFAYEKGVVEKDNLGEVLVEYTQTQINKDQILLTRDYDSEDIVKKFVKDVKNPSIDYDREILMEVDSGVVEAGNSVFEISLGKEEYVLTLDENSEANVETQALGGELRGNVIQEFWKIETEQSKSVAEGLVQYKNKAELVNVFLYNHDVSTVKLGDGKEEEFEIVDIDVPDQVTIIETSGPDVEKPEDQIAEFQYQTQEQTQVLQMTSPSKLRKLQSKGDIFRETTLASIGVFGSTVKVDLVYSGRADKNNISVDLKVNSRVIKKIINISFNQCKTTSNNIQNANQDFTLFTAVFPVFGIITINVSAKTRIQYGFTTSASGQSGSCTMTAKPWLRTALYADGKASLAGVISAGIYAQGNFLDSALTLSSGVTPYQSYASLSGDFHAYSTEVGLTYTKISCSLKNVTGRRLEENQQENSVSPKRSLGFLKKVKKVVSKVTTTVKKAATTAVKVVNTAVNVVQNLKNICTTSNGYKQLYKSSSPRQTKTFFNQRVNY
ncbi:Insulin-like growth factor binding protein, N-terminal [Pseudocohnilembus persalinus]|uniref:Insulin-like growth factor binding protein, N-terminal n=1 Tax=Pseudocohnilembus persalinus TaxID=266149 RepID=A0A0V0QGY9_PSEPJ|nr:Insulin-like growth factor binding protein, N-terminal [Pseudocohnilembus persalinus]|eukprot:KRX01474.1 Insulin-like growth factor binding protein, N-terminal [Pseudocohnilembus persalinus]